MNSKDLLSINEAFAKASSKVTADEPAKKDEVVTDNTKSNDIVEEAAPAIAKKPVAKSKEETKEAAKPDYIDADGDGNKEEPMKKALKDKKKVKENSIDTIMADYENSLSKNYGVKNIKEKSKNTTDKQRPKGEVTAEVQPDSGCDRVHDDLQEPVEAKENDEKKPKNEKKLAKESINNCNKGNIMSEDKSIFDKLYESVMGEDDELELGIPGDSDPAAGDEFGDEGGEEVTVTLTPDQAAALKAVVDQLPSDEEEPGDVGDEDPLADTDELEDSVQEDTTATSDGKKPGVDPSDGGGDTTEPAADSLGGKSTGTGDTNKDHGETTGQATSDGKKPGDTKHGKPGSQAV